MIKMMCSVIDDASYHCKTQLRRKTFSYTWSVDDFWKIYKFGIKFESSCTKNNFVFSICPKQDKLEFYGVIKKARYNPTTCFYSISLKTNKGIIYKTRAGNCLMNQNRPELFYDPPISFFLDNQTEYLLNGTLTIYFELHILDELINNSINHEIYEILPITNTDSFGANKISDTVTFVVNKKQTLQANKNLLCLKSKVFKAMFDCDLKESKTNKIEITDISYNILKELLSFLQTRHLSKHIRKNAEATCELFIAADKYDIEDLKFQCEQCLIRNTTTENVVEYLKFAHLNNGKILEKYAKKFIKLYLKDIADTVNFITLMQEYPELLKQIEDSYLSTTKAYKYNPQ